MENGPQCLLQLWAFMTQSMSEYRPNGYPFDLEPSSINLLAAGSLISSILMLCYNMGETRLKILEEKEMELERKIEQKEQPEEQKDKNIEMKKDIALDNKDIKNQLIEKGKDKDANKSLIKKGDSSINRDNNL